MPISSVLFVLALAALAAYWLGRAHEGSRMDARSKAQHALDGYAEEVRAARAAAGAAWDPGLERARIRREAALKLFGDSRVDIR